MVVGICVLLIALTLSNLHERLECGYVGVGVDVLKSKRELAKLRGKGETFL